MNQFITPILLGYVDRYIKNFQPKDWQVSLWEGDATFNNLELRPEVLEEDFKVPFSLVSGQIYELLIHVPWTRLTWEPVVVTLNTIECILKLRSGEPSLSQHPRKRQDTENHPSYIQGLVSKILNNITVVCNNLSVKYIEEDIVLSMHVKNLTFQAVDQHWNPTFSEITEPVLRKKISVSDLTVCLDKRNASGKIEAYHEPVLYRSSLEFRLLTYQRTQPDGNPCSVSDLHANKANEGIWPSEDNEEKFLVIRLDVCATQILDFQLNEEQLPMFFRLCELSRALAKGEIPKTTDSGIDDGAGFASSTSEKSGASLPPQNVTTPRAEQEERGITDSTKMGWSEYFTNFFPTTSEEWFSDETPHFQPQIWDFGLYVKKLSLELKIIDRGQQDSYYGPSKVVRPCTKPFAAVVLQGVSAQLLKLGAQGKDDEGARTMFNMRMGASRVLVKPVGGLCPCGTRDGSLDSSEDFSEDPIKDKEESFFVYAGGELENYDQGSLFDDKCLENCGVFKPYNCSRVCHLETVTETTMLDRTPALALDFLYTVETPAEWNLESLAKLANFEDCNFSEESLIRILFGPSRLKMCASFLHRLKLLMHLASQCDYPPYIQVPPPPDPSAEKLVFKTFSGQEISSKDFPSEIYRITLFRPLIQFYLDDHPDYKPGERLGKRKSKSKLSRKKVTNFEDMPSVSFQSKYIDAKIVAPMYPYRLMESWKNVQKVPPSVMDIMYSCGTAEVTDIACHVTLEGRQTTAFVLNGINYIQKRLILPEYWSQKDLISLERFIQCESLRVAATKVKLDIIMGIMYSFFKTSNRTENSRIISLIPHAISDQDHTVADLCLDGLGMKYLLTQLVEGYHISVSSLKVLLLKADASKGDLKQTLILSGPEVWNGGENEESATPYLLKATLQKKIDSTSTNTATKLINPLLAFQINHAHLFVDQLLIDWLSPMCIADSTCSSDSNILELKKSHAPLLLRRAASEEAPTTTLSTSEAPIRYRRASTSSSSRTLPPAPPESVHSSSERGASGSKALSGGPVVFGSSSALAEVEEDDTKDETMEDCPEDHDVAKPQQTFLETVLDIFKSWSCATVVGKMKQWTAYVPAVLGDGCISSEGAENIPQTVTNAVSSGKAIGALVIDLPSISLHSAGVQGDVFLQSCLVNFPMKTTANNLEKNISVNFPWSLSMSNLKINTLHSMKVLPFLKPVTTILTLGVTASTSPVIFAPGGTLNLCIHVDTSALMFSVSEIQWETITNIVGRLSLISGSSGKEASEKVKKTHSNVCKPFLPSPSSVTSIHQTSSVSIIDNTSVPCGNKDSSASNGVKLAALVQWTLARLAVSLYASPQPDRKSKEKFESSLKVTKKLYMALEDLITSVDIKEVYLKIESKVASARVAHYLRTDPSSEWKPGAYLGLVMHCNEDSPSSKVVGGSSGVSGESKENSSSKDRDTSKPHPLKSSRPFPLFALTEDSSQELHRKDTGVGISSGGSPATSGGFLVVTFTKAQSLSVHQKWGKLQKRIDSSNAVSSDPNVYPAASPGSMPSSSPNFPSASNVKFSSDGCLLPPFKSGANHHSKLYLGESALPSRNTTQRALSLNAFDESHYVSELSVRVQPLDIIFSPENLRDFWVIFHHISNPFNDTKESSTSVPESSSSNYLDEWCSSTIYSNLNLPLLYVDAHNLRLILPSSQLSKKISELQDDGDRESAAVMGFHDVCIFQVDRLSIAPQVENPIGRLEIRPDIYGMADEARILGIPGSLVEDRQYLVQVHNISISTGMWYELQPCFEKDPMVSSTHMRSENPALEWSKLAKGKSCLGQELSVLPLVNRFDFTITAAPAIVYRVPYDGVTTSEDILVAGYAMEMHASSNIDACVSSHQLELLAELVSEANSLFQKSDGEDDILKSKLASKSSEILVTTVLNEKEDERIGDSGVDVSSSGCLGTPVGRSVSTQQIYSSYSSSLKITDSAEKVCTNSLRKEVPVPLEVFVTCEKLTLVLYDVTGSTGIAGRAKESGASRRKHYAKRTGSTNLSRQYTSDKWGQRLMRNSSDLGYDGSEEGSIEDAPSGSVSYYVHPLLHWFVTEPHAVLSLGPSSQKFQLSVFDVGVRTSGSGYVVQGGGQKLVPRLEDFHVQILETKSGERHPKTGIPPSFLTITWTDILSPSGQMKVEVGRPVKVHGSVPRWKYLRDVFRRLDDSTKCLKQEFLNKEAGSTSKELGLTRAKEDGMFADLLPYLKNCSYTFVTDQLVISVELVGRNNGIRKELSDEVTLALSSFRCNIWSTEGLIPLEMKYKASKKEAVPNRVHGNVKVSSVTASITHCGRKRVLLYPWSFGIDGTVIWEPWMNPCHPPRMQLNADSETILVELGPDHLVLFNTALSDFQSVISPERSSEYLNEENGKESDSKEDMISAEDYHDSLPLVEAVTAKDGIYTTDTLNKPYSGQFAPSISYHSQFTDISCASSPAKEQHYQDDLRAGAFIFLDNFVTHTSSPFPYQVIFNKSPPTMTWCYPEPRTLTRVDVYPVPFVIASESMSGMSSFPHGQCATDQVICSLQYWCDCRNQFNDYCHFQLSESSSTKLDLPSLLEPSRLAIARIWRVQLQLQSKADSREDGILREQVTMSPRSLVGCMRVDSYFSPSLIPAFEASLNLTSFRITFSNHLTHVVKKLPKPLHSFTYDDAMPDNQPFCTMSIDGAELFFCIKEPLAKSEQHPASVVANFKSHFRLDVIDYAFLTQQCVIEPFLVEALLTLVDTGPGSFKTATFNIFSKPITIHFGAAPAHTFFNSMQLWKDVLKSMAEDEKTTSNNRYMTLVTRYVICNDTMQSIRFGQTDSPESIQIGSRQCHFYSWFSQKQKQALTFSLERSGRWMNTLAVNIDYEGTKLCRWDKDNPEINLFVNVESLSATQKKVTVLGQLMVTNLLMEPVDLQIPFDSWQLEDDSSAEEEKREKKEVTQALVIPVSAQSTPASVIPSMLATSELSYFRIRFQGTSDGLTNGAWSGKVPLLPDCPRDFVSYPVKVPLHERNHYYCVWCRVVYQKIENVRRILVVISPLFAVRSYLPVSADVEVTTPDMVVKMRTCARGRGTDQEIYCPGTTETKHVLEFILEGQPPFNVPMSYQMLKKNQQILDEAEPSKGFFKASSIEEVLKQLQQSFREPESKWPYVGEEFNGIDWVAGPLSQTDIQISYVNPCYHCNTLLVQVSPKVLLVNVLGIEIYLTSEVEEVVSEDDSLETIRRVSRVHTRQTLCSVPHHGVIAAPKLEGIFHLGIRLMEHDDETDDEEKLREEDRSGEMFFSPPMQLSTDEWAGNKPHISGVVPLEGSARTRIFCGKYVCFLVITSMMTSFGVRVLTVRPMYTLCNHTLERFRLSALSVICSQSGDQKKKRVAVPHTTSLLDIPPGEGENNVSHDGKVGDVGHILGWPIILWTLIQPSNQLNRHDGYSRLVGEQRLEPYIQLGMDGPSGDLVFGCPLKVGMSPENPSLGGIPSSSQPKRVSFTIPLPSVEEKDDRITRIMKRRVGYPADSTLQVANRPFVMTMHEKEGQSFLVIHDDPCPQLEVHNLCSFDILIGQVERNDPNLGPSDSEHLQWLTVIQSGTSAFYSLPSRSSNFPDIYSPGDLQPPLVLAGGDFPLDEDIPLDMWSECVQIDNLHLSDPEGQFVRLFPGRDVRVRVAERQNQSNSEWGKSCLLLLTVEPAPRASVLAKDVRERLGATLEPSNASYLSAKLGNPISSAPLASGPSAAVSFASVNESDSSSSNVVAATSSTTMYADSYDCQYLSFIPYSLSFLLSAYNYGSPAHAEEKKWQMNFTFLLSGASFSLMDDLHPPWERKEVILLSLNDVSITSEPADAASATLLNVIMSVGDCQLDNQQHVNYDFPVILVRDGSSYNPCLVNSVTSSALLSKPSSLVSEVRKEALFTVIAGVKLGDSYHPTSLLKTIEVNTRPMKLYLEDTFDLYLMDICLSLLPSSLLFQPSGSKSAESSLFSEPRDYISADQFPPHSPWSPGHIFLPQEPFLESLAVAKPLRLKRLSLSPASLLVSLHTYAGVYIAANHSPLQFSSFVRTHLFTSSYELGRALTVHYRSGVLLCAGWVLGSLELLGSPGGLACTVGRGIRDFLHLPLAGILQGPWGFVLGVLHGSASLMKHITAGTVTSVTMLASSVARNLDQLTLDEEHRKWSEEVRRRPPKGVAQGLLRGLTGLGISLLGAVGGIVYHPMQSMVNEGSQGSIVSGVGKGLVGVITKPLSGAAELVALTGQGLLHGTGWSNLPLPRQPPLIETIYDSSDSQLKYIWKILPLSLKSCSFLPPILFQNSSDVPLTYADIKGFKCFMIMEAMSVSPAGVYSPVTIILTTEGLLIVKLEEQKESKGTSSSEKPNDFFWISLREVSGMEPSSSDPTLLRLQLTHMIEPVTGADVPPVSTRSRIAEYVRDSSLLVCPVQISGPLGATTVNDWTCLPPAPEPVSAVCSAQNMSPISSRSQSPSLPRAPRSSSPVPSTSSARSSFPSLAEKSGSCSGELSDQHLAAYSENICKLQDLVVQPGLPMMFHVAPAAGVHFLSLLKLIKRQSLGKGYPVL